MVSCYNVQEKGGFLLPLDELLFPRTGSQPLGPTILGEIYTNIGWDIYKKIKLDIHTIRLIN